MTFDTTPDPAPLLAVLAPPAGTTDPGPAGWQPITSCPRQGEVLLFFPATRNHRSMVRTGRPGEFPYRLPSLWAPIPPPPEDPTP